MPALHRLALSACVIALALPFAACQPKRKPLPQTNQQKQPQAPNELTQIQMLEDRRALSNGLLVQWSQSHADPLIRGRALLALARIQAPSTASAIAQGLTDPAPLPRYEAAFAAGALGTWQPLKDDVRDMLVDKLLAAEERETEEPVKLAQLEALGKIATPKAMERLTDRLLGTSPAVAGRAALSLGVGAKKGTALPARAITSLAPLMANDADTAATFGAAYALAMSKLPAARPGLLRCTKDQQSEVRILCAKGLGDIGTDTDAVTLKQLLDDPDYRVVVEATRALAKLADRCKSASCPAIGALSDLSFRVDRLKAGDLAGGAQPLLALAQQGLPASGRALLTTLRGKVVSAASQVQGALRGDIANIDCRLAAAMDKQRGQLQEILNCGGGLVSEAARLSLGLNAIAEVPSKNPAQRVEEVAPYLRHGDPKVKTAALHALAATRSISAADRIRPLIASTDLVIAAAAANAAGEVGDTGAIPAIRQLAVKVVKSPEYCEPIGDALAALNAKDAEVELRTWLNHPHRQMRIVAARALTKITGQPVEVPEVEYPENTPFKAPPHFSKTAKLVIKTEKGEIEIKPYDDAPMTAANIWSLAQRGYFRNVTFHRVVPDFAVQGGDPRGDGEGGPGYTIRCEVNHRPYARGVVGMALSGPDTGGSQFFITHSPQPHLDGRYTAFGEVISGRDVADKLLEGDRILEVRASF